MRILISIHYYPPFHCAGSEMMAHNIGRHLAQQGHQVRAIIHQYNGRGYEYEGVEVCPATGHVDAYAWATHIITHLEKTQLTLLMAFAVKRPLIHLVHNDIPYSCINNASKHQYIVYNSEWIKNSLNYNHPSAVLHPPTNLQEFPVINNPQSNEATTLINLNESKGGYMLYKIAKAMPDRKFIGVVGGYENMSTLQIPMDEIANKLRTLPNVEVVEHSPNIQATYNRTRLLLMPSDYESWGRTATEAMASGIPVICTPTPGLKENCGDAAEYVGNRIKESKPGEPQVTTGTAEQWITAIKKFDSVKYYREKSVLCTERARELDPRRELEALEQFIINARF